MRVLQYPNEAGDAAKYVPDPHPQKDLTKIDNRKWHYLRFSLGHI